MKRRRLIRLSARKAPTVCIERDAMKVVEVGERKTSEKEPCIDPLEKYIYQSPSTDTIRHMARQGWKQLYPATNLFYAEYVPPEQRHRSSF